MAFWLFIYQIPMGMSKRDKEKLIFLKSLENYRADATVSFGFHLKKNAIGKGSRGSMTES